MTPPSPRIEVLDALRGLAALAVCWFHFAHEAGGWLGASGAYGWLGVEVFFVLSGFVIPLALLRAGYEPRRNGGRFVAKRVLRLDPPYFAAVALVVGLKAAAGIENYTAGQVASHVAYLTAFLGYEWLSPVFWTLGIEFQYYLLMAAAFPLFAHPDDRVGLGAALALAATAALGLPRHVLLAFGPLFALGILAFRRASGLTPAPRWAAASAAAAALGLLFVGPAETAVAVAAALAIVYVRRGAPRPLLWLGTVSYSLYLFHAPVGGTVVSMLATRAATPPLALALIGMAVSIGAAWVAYLVLERPSQALSSRVGYRRAGELVTSDLAGRTG